MLALYRKLGQWTHITDPQGNLIRFKVYRSDKDGPDGVRIAFDDDARHFEVNRPEAIKQPPKPTL